MNSTPDVSVYMLTYFHEKYVSQAIESILSQKTKYSFELVISDDCSKDGTTDILKDYEQKYPDIIRVNCNETNIGIPANMYKARCMCRGRYISVCSGDDYWIRDDKLELEVGFLESNPGYVAVCNRVELRMDGSNIAYDVVPRDKKYVDREYTIRDYERCRRVGLHGCVMHNFFLTEEGRNYFAEASKISKYVDDAVDELLLLRKGAIYVMDLASDAHRIVPSDKDHNNYNSRYSKLEKFGQHIDLLNGMDARWGNEIDFTYHYAQHYATGFLSMLTDRQNKSEYKRIMDTIPDKYVRPWFKGIKIRSIPFMCSFVVSRFRRKK